MSYSFPHLHLSTRHVLRASPDLYLIWNLGGVQHDYQKPRHHTTVYVLVLLRKAKLYNCHDNHFLLQGTLVNLVCWQMKLLCAVKEIEAELLCGKYTKQKMIPLQRDRSGLIEMENEACCSVGDVH